MTGSTLIRNPNKMDIPGSIRDPMIVNDNGKYYMVATSPHFGEGYNPGVKLWSSDDLANWKYEKTAVPSGKIGEDARCKNRFWAPEIFIHKKKYYITFSARNEKHDTPFEMFIAYSNKIDGEYTVIENPIVDGNFIDAHLFCDDDGKIYLFYSNKDIYMSLFDINALRAVGAPKKVLNKGTDNEWDGSGIEGAFVVKRSRVYYLWYSSWTRGYEMGLATSESLSEPFVKPRNNPVISGIDTPIYYAGHNSCFKLKDGRDAIAYHGYSAGEPEGLCIDIVTYPLESRVPPTEIYI